MVWDLIVLGGGPAGYVAAIRAAQLGASVVLVEKDTPGGTCLNRGCIPTKALYRNAQMLDLVKQMSKFGISIDGYSFDYIKAHQREKDIVNRLVNGVRQLLKANGVKVVCGQGSFTEERTIEVEDPEGKKELLEGKNILIATGSVPAMPPIPGLDLSGVLTSNELLELQEIPESMVVIGGGVVGMEFAGIFNAFGTKVTVVEYLPRILPPMDEDIVKRLVPTLKRKGISIETGSKVKEIRKTSDGLTVVAEGAKGEFSVDAQKVLVSTGRSINIKGLNLDKAGVIYDGKGIKVNEHFETNIKGIFAAGDVIGGQMLAHLASHEGITAVENMMGIESTVDYDAVPNCVFTFPEIASVGLTEEEAKNRGTDYVTDRFMFGANGKALTLGEEEGFVKVIADKNSKKLLGVHIMGPHASDLIHEAALAVSRKLAADDIIETIHAHPTLSETLAEAVAGIEDRAIHSAPRKK